MNETLTKIGEQQVIHSQIKEKFNHLRRMGKQIREIEAEAEKVKLEIEELSDRQQQIADWLCEKEYEALNQTPF